MRDTTWHSQEETLPFGLVFLNHRIVLSPCTAKNPFLIIISIVNRELSYFRVCCQANKHTMPRSASVFGNTSTLNRIHRPSAGIRANQEGTVFVAMPHLVSTGTHFCRAEQAVRSSAQNAIDEAERRAKLARDEFEQSTIDLDAELRVAKVSTLGGNPTSYKSVNVLRSPIFVFLHFLFFFHVW